MNELYPVLNKTMDLLPILDWSEEQIKVLMAAMNMAYDKGRVDGMRFADEHQKKG